MIDYITELKMVQSRGHKIVYPDLNDLNSIKDYGCPKDIIPNRETELKLELHLIYDKEDAHLVQDLTKAIIKINQEIVRRRHGICTQVTEVPRPDEDNGPHPADNWETPCPK